MESIYSGLEQLGELIQWPYLAIFLLLSYLIKKYFESWLNMVTPFIWKSVYTVLILATIIAIPFLVIEPDNWVNILLTYAVGTSFHEIILGKLVDKLKGE